MTQPVDPDFAARVAAYQAQRAKGLVFQADGTLGGIALKPRRAPRRNLPARLLGLVLMFGLVFAIKATVLQVMGVAAYNGNLARLTASTSVVDNAVAALLHLDPITLTFSDAYVSAQRAAARQVRALQ